MLTCFYSNPCVLFCSPKELSAIPWEYRMYIRFEYVCVNMRITNITGGFNMKYVSMKMVKKEIAEKDLATLEYASVISSNKQGHILFNGKQVPLDKKVAFIEYLMEKFMTLVLETPAPTAAPIPVDTKEKEKTVTPPAWNKEFVELPSVGGKSTKRLSVRVWCELMIREGVDTKQAMYICHHVLFNKCKTASKSTIISALTGKSSTFNTTWRTRLIKLINTL